MKRVRIALSIILIFVFGYIVIGEFVLPGNTPMNGNICEILPGDAWVEIKADGTKVPFSVPGKTDGDITLETTLPSNFDRDVSALCFRGMDMEIYVGDVERARLATEDYRFFGDQSAECYVMASLYPEDAGKTLRVHYEYNSGVVYEVYYGTRLGILTFLFGKYGIELLVGLSILLLGIICLVASVSYRLIYKRYLEMEHLSLGVIIGSCWVLSNSIFRQLYTRNLSVMSDIPFLMVMIMPLPFLIFVNSLQSGRYSKMLTIAALISIANTIICISLFVTGKVGLISSFPFSALCALASIIMLVISIIKDARRHLSYSYRYVSIGFVVLAIAAVIQIAVYQFAHNGAFSGAIMAFGLFVFLICSIVHTIKQLIGIRLEANELASISKAKDDFLANMSHEIRTPMNAIIGMDEMILRRTSDEKIKRYALDIRSAGKTLLSIINDILDLSKIESGKLEIIPVEYGFSSVVNDIINMTMKKAQDKGLEYNLRVSPLIPSILKGDETRIRQIMLNLINNSIKYTQKGSVNILLSFDNESRKLRIIVKDTGIGIRKEDIDKLFVSFNRLEESRNRNIEGTGLGLNITKQLAEMMGGEVSVESEYGKGSVFTATVVQEIIDRTPIGDFAENIAKAQEELEEYKPSLYAPDARILIVDDNEMNLEVITNLLSDTGVQIVTAMSGQECIDILLDSSFDVVLLDQMMPGMTGAITLEIIRQKHIADGVPVIALTADAVVSARESYLKLGFTDYLSKPVIFSDLEAILRKYIDKSLLRDISEYTEKRNVAKDGVEDAKSAKRPLVIVVSDNPDELAGAKELINEGGKSDKYKGVFVRDIESASKYLEKHKTEN